MSSACLLYTSCGQDPHVEIGVNATHRQLQFRMVRNDLVRRLSLPDQRTDDPVFLVKFLSGHCLLYTSIFLSGFFSSAETALSTVNRVRMRTLEEEGSKRAARVNKVLDNYSKMIASSMLNLFFRRMSMESTINLTMGSGVYHAPKFFLSAELNAFRKSS